MQSSRSIQNGHCSPEGRPRPNISRDESGDVGGPPSVYDEASRAESPVLGNEIAMELVTPLLHELRGQG